MFFWHRVLMIVLAISFFSIASVQATERPIAFTIAATPALTPATATYTLVSNPGSVTGGSDVTLSLASTNYAGTVSFSTSVTSTNGTASNVSANAPSVTLTNGGNGSSVLTITANANAANHAPVKPWESSAAVMFGAVLLGAPFTLRRKRVMAVLLALLAISLAGFLMSCGGGGSSTTKPTPVAVAAASRTYTVTVTPTGTGTVKNPPAVNIAVAVP